MAPDDGRVVALTHGCGAHSETVVETQESTYAGMAVEDDEFEVVERELPVVGDAGQDEAVQDEAVQDEAVQDEAVPDEAVQDDAVQDDAIVATADAPEDAGVPGVDDPPLDDVVDEEDAPPAELAGGLADDEPVDAPE
jgi:hypothetical protein